MDKDRARYLDIEQMVKHVLRDAQFFYVNFIHFISQRREFYKITNGVAQVPFEGVLIEVYKDTRRKHNEIQIDRSYN